MLRLHEGMASGNTLTGSTHAWDMFSHLNQGGPFTIMMSQCCPSQGAATLSVISTSVWLQTGDRAGVEKDADLTKLRWEQVARREEPPEPWSRQHKPCSMVIHCRQNLFQQWDSALR
jgi:hypothetical protein